MTIAPIYTNLDRLAEALLPRSSRIVFTGGTFDLLHSGHLWYLQEAAKQGEKLVVMIASDTAVKATKGSLRPIYDEKHRSNLIASLRFVDYVLISDVSPFDYKTLDKLAPDVFIRVKRDEYSDVERQQEIDKYKARYPQMNMVFLPTLPSYSTSATIKHILTTHSQTQFDQEYASRET